MITQKKNKVKQKEERIMKTITILGERVKKCVKQEENRSRPR